MSNLILVGVASWYSVQFCLGCSPSLTMANGERLDDTKLTIALTPPMYRKYKNKYLGVINVKNKKSVIVKVTDTGGFYRLNRVADLSLATKNALECSSLCRIEIIE